jgi:hypothetical protein
LDFIPEINNSNAFIAFYDIYGTELKKVQITEKGFGNINVNTQNLSSGIYAYSLIINGVVKDTKQMLKN